VVTISGTILRRTRSKEGRRTLPMLGSVCREGARWRPRLAAAIADGMLGGELSIGSSATTSLPDFVVISLRQEK
jgi:hypothetical protein